MGSGPSRDNGPEPWVEHVTPERNEADVVFFSPEAKKMNWVGIGRHIFYFPLLGHPCARLILILLTSRLRGISDILSSSCWGEGGATVQNKSEAVAAES